MTQPSGFAHLANTSLWPAVSQSGWVQQPQHQKPTPVFIGSSDQRVAHQDVPTDDQPQQDFKSGPQPSQWMKAMQAKQQPWGGRKSSKKYKSKKSKRSKRSKKSSKKSRKSKRYSRRRK